MEDNKAKRIRRKLPEGYYSKRIAWEKRSEEIFKNANTKTEDNDYRDKIKKILATDIAYGATEKEAIENIMKNPIIEHIKYIGDVENALRNWINTGYVKNLILSKRQEIAKSKNQENKGTAGIEIDDDGR